MVPRLVLRLLRMGYAVVGARSMVRVVRMTREWVVGDGILRWGGSGLVTDCG